MKTKVKSEKSLDAVKMMREIRDRIDRDLEGMTSNEVLSYYDERKRKVEEWKKSRKSE